MSYTLQNNTPSSGCIQWTGLKMQYNGAVYTIADGYSGYAYAYWLATNPSALVVSDSYPSLTRDDCLVFLNKNGIGVVVPGATTLDGSLIVPGTVLASAIAANSITGDKIAAGAIEAGNIAAGAISANLIAANAVGADKIAANAITSDKLVAGAVTTDKLAAGAVTANRIAAGAITAAKIQAGAIETSHLSAGIGAALDISGNEAITLRVTKADMDAKLTMPVLAKCDIPAGRLIAGDAQGYSPLAAGVPFDADKPILWTEDAIAEGETGVGYPSRADCDLTGAQGGIIGTAGQTCYLKGTLDGTRITPPDTGAYQYLEYIESTGTQYIDTGIVGNSDTTSYEVRANLDELTQTNPYPSLIGARNGVINRLYTYILDDRIWYGDNGSDLSARGVRYSGATNWGFNLAGTKAHTCNDAVYATLTKSYTSGSMWLFDCNMGAGQLPNQRAILAKMYYCKIWDNGVIVRDLVPCRRLFDGAIGMYDRVSGAFFGNAGTGEFIAGENINAFLTCEQPTSENGLTYLTLGQLTSETTLALIAEHPLSRYVGTAFKPLTQVAFDAHERASQCVTAVDVASLPSGGVVASHILIEDDNIEVVSGGNFSIKGGAAQGEYLGISTTDDTTIFTGADDASGTGAKFSLSKQGEAQMRDARVSGEVEVNGEMTFGEGVAVTFQDDAARQNFLRALASGDALPFHMGGTNALSRQGAMGNFGLIVGMDEPGEVTPQNVGDRYLLVKPGMNTTANTIALTSGGYYCEKVSQQRRLKTVRTYAYIQWQEGVKPSDSTTYSSWADTETSYGDLSEADTPYCHEASGTASSQYSGSVTTSYSTGGESGSTWTITTKTNYEYRTYTRLVYRAVLPAPTAGTTDADIKSLSVKTALLTLATDATESGKYSFYLADSVDGQTGKTLIGTVTGTGSLSFSLLDHIADLYNGVKYLVIERAGSSSAITVTAATLTLTYFSGARRTEEYAWNGTEWRPLAIGTEYFFDEANDAVIAVNDYLFTVPITDGHESSQYEFEFLGKANANSTTKFILCLNGDNVYANYRSRVIYGSNVYSERARIGNTGSIATPTFARGTITVIGGYVVVTGQGMWASYNTAYSVVYGDGETELTAINIRVEGSAAGVGCRMKVKRK